MLNLIARSVSYVINTFKKTTNKSGGEVGSLLGIDVSALIV